MGREDPGAAFQTPRLPGLPLPPETDGPGRTLLPGSDGHRDWESSAGAAMERVRCSPRRRETVVLRSAALETRMMAVAAPRQAAWPAPHRNGPFPSPPSPPASPADHRIAAVCCELRPAFIAESKDTRGLCRSAEQGLRRLPAAPRCVPSLILTSDQERHGRIGAAFKYLRRRTA